MWNGNWAEKLPVLKRLIMQPIHFQNVSITLLDALSAEHPGDWYSESHRHPWFEFNYVAEGAVYTTFDDAEFAIAAGESYMVPPGTMHSHRNAEGVGDNGFCLRWQIARLPAVKPGLLHAQQPALDVAGSFLDVMSQPRPYAFDGGVELLLQRIDRGGSLAALETVFLVWLWSLYDGWSSVAETADANAADADRREALVQQALLFLNNYYASSIKVRDIANSLNISYRSLARIFKEKTGFTIIEKLNDIRVNEAKKMLKETDKPLRQIALETGFENEFYFSNMFRRYALIAPSDFRLNARK